MFTDAPEVEGMANVMIDNLPEFEHLRDKPIGYAFSDKAVMLGGEALMGKVVKAPTAWKGDGLADFKLLINGQSYDGLDSTQRQALIHGLLMQIGFKTVHKRTGQTIQVPHIRRPDVCEFTATRKRFGDWTEVHEKYATVERETLQEVVDRLDAEEANDTPEENDTEDRNQSVDEQIEV